MGDPTDGPQSLSEWMAGQQELVAQQTENINSLVGGIDSLHKGLLGRPTMGKVIAIVCAVSLISNAATVGFVGWSRLDLKKGQEAVQKNINDKLDRNAAASLARGKRVIDLTERIDDCLDTTTADGDPIGKCAAQSQARLTAAIAAITQDVTCADEKLILDFISKNPGLGITAPSPRPECLSGQD